MVEDLPTRERLLQAGMRLFAERGFRATRVGDIEAAAGLQPRRGALYNHFESKEALLEEAARRSIESVSVSTTQLDRLPIPAVGIDDVDLLRPVLTQLAHWFLSSVDQDRPLIQLLEHEGDLLRDIGKLLEHDIIDQGNRAASDLLRSAVPALRDPDAAAVMLLNSLVGLRRTTWTFGDAPLGMSDERAIEQWVDLVIGLVVTSLPHERRRRRRS